METIFYILFFIAGISFGIWIKRKKKISFQEMNPKKLEEVREKSKEALSERTDERKEKILEFMKAQLEHQKELEDCKPGISKQGISRKDIENLLDVSTQTALKYLNLLEEENKIKQIGQSGKDVHYTLNS